MLFQEFALSVKFDGCDKNSRLSLIFSPLSDILHSIIYNSYLRQFKIRNLQEVYLL